MIDHAPRLHWLHLVHLQQKQRGMKTQILPQPSPPEKTVSMAGCLTNGKVEIVICRIY